MHQTSQYNQLCYPFCQQFHFQQLARPEPQASELERLGAVAHSQQHCDDVTPEIEFCFFFFILALSFFLYHSVFSASLTHFGEARAECVDDRSNRKHYYSVIFFRLLFFMEWKEDNINNSSVRNLMLICSWSNEQIAICHPSMLYVIIIMIMKYGMRYYIHILILVIIHLYIFTRIYIFTH